MPRSETKHTIAGLLGLLAVVFPSAATGQVKTTVPDIVAGAASATPADDEALAAVKTAGDSAKLPFRLRAQLAAAAAWSPNPNNAPLYLDLPAGTNQPAVLARRAANASLAFIDQYFQPLREYRAIAVDVGDQDGLKADTGKLHDARTTYGITHTFEIYSGTHTSHVAVRFQDKVLPFFSKTLSFEQRR